MTVGLANLQLLTDSVNLTGGLSLSRCLSLYSSMNFINVQQHY